MIHEKILPLALECGLLSSVDYKNEQMLFVSEYADEKTVEEFAVLIIKECAGINYISPFQDGEHHAREVLENFNLDERALK